MDFVNKERTFAAADAKGGCEVVSAKTAIVCIEYQNEFTTEGGKLHGAVKACMEATGMLDKSVKVCAAARAKGVKVFHVPITFCEDGSDNPNPGIGILSGCDSDRLFIKDTWNSEICAAMKPVEGDVLVTGKHGLDAFPGSDFEQLLVAHGIETIVLCGFLTNCCVESTMRTACEKGFNTITLTDCCSTTSLDGHSAATAGTFGMFSTPMDSECFIEEILDEMS